MLYLCCMNSLREVEYLVNAPFIKTNLPDFSAGDTVKLFLRIKEGNKERIQVFEGTVIQRRGSGVNEMITVRKISNGVGVERIVPLHGPVLEKIEVVRRGRVRRARIFYIRQRIGKAAKIRRAQST